MEMTKEKILKEYAEAKDKANEIKVLADLNVTSCRAICNILTEAGIPLPPKKGGWGRPPKAVAEAKKAEAAEAAPGDMTEEQKDVLVKALNMLIKYNEELKDSTQRTVNYFKEQIEELEERMKSREEEIEREKADAEIARGLLEKIGGAEKNETDEKRDC